MTKKYFVFLAENLRMGVDYVIATGRVVSFNSATASGEIVRKGQVVPFRIVTREESLRGLGILAYTQVGNVPVELRRTTEQILLYQDHLK